MAGHCQMKLGMKSLHWHFKDFGHVIEAVAYKLPMAVLVNCCPSIERLAQSNPGEKVWVDPELSPLTWRRKLNSTQINNQGFIHGR